MRSSFEPGGPKGPWMDRVSPTPGTVAAMIQEPRISLFHLVECLSKAMDLVSPLLADHHERVAFIAFKVAQALDLPERDQRDLALAGALHDSGALSVQERIEFLEFDLEDTWVHSELGYRLLQSFAPVRRAAEFVRYHHVWWSQAQDPALRGRVPLGSHVLHLADRVAVLLRTERDILSHVEGICRKIRKRRGEQFAPRVVDAFLDVAGKECFWLHAVSRSPAQILRRCAWSEAAELNMDGLVELSGLFRQVIDFRSRFTATHSVGVAASAEALARLCGFSQRECVMIRVAGHVHDLGKLVVPVEILEKPGPLHARERALIRTHTFYTYQILSSVEDLRLVNEWASFHHERLDGSGYPFHHGGADLSLGARIMAVADVFTALSEDRPYRKGLPREDVLQALRRMAGEGALDASLVRLLAQEYESIDRERRGAQENAEREYRTFAPSGSDRGWPSPHPGELPPRSAVAG